MNEEEGDDYQDAVESGKVDADIVVTVAFKRSSVPFLFLHGSFQHYVSVYQTYRTTR